MPKDPRFDVHLNAEFDAPPSEALDGDTFRIALIGNFSGRSAARANDVPLERRRVWRVDRDEVDGVIAGIAPQLAIAVDPSEPPLVIRFASLDEFHPDSLIERLPLFQRLRALKTQAGGSPKQTLPKPAARPAAGAARADTLLSSGSLLDQIIGNDPASASGSDTLRVASRDELTDFVDRAVRPHVVQESSREEKELSAKIDDVIAATMRVILHHPDFQALESAWRSVDFIVRRLDTGESLQVVLMDASRDEVMNDLGSGASVEGTALARLIRSGRGASVFAGLFAFGPDDLAVVSRLATIGRLAQAPWIVGADPRLGGAPSFVGSADPEDWDASLPAGWDSLRRSPDASFLSMVLPRFLLRLPYGAKTDACAFPFEEMLPGAPDHESYLWGNAAILAAVAIGDSVSAGDAPATQAELSGFPLHVVTIDGEPTATPCTEALISHAAATHMLDRGLTPIASPRDGDTILLPRLQSVAQPARRLSIRTGAA